MNIPALLHNLLRLKRPHKGAGELKAQALVMNELQGMGLVPEVDRHGNISCRVGEDNGAVFTAHLDTVHRVDGDLLIYGLAETGELVADDAETNKPAVLGADDAAGVYLLTELARAETPGLYLFFVGEEVGGIGSSNYVKDNPGFSASFVVSFDRRGYSDVITHQGYYRTASDEFASAIAVRLNRGMPSEKPLYAACDGGIYTDSKEFAGVVPECTNISVGYFNEHTTHETLDLEHLLALRTALLSIDWAELPIKRVPEDENSLPWQDYFTDGGTLPTRYSLHKHSTALRAKCMEESLTFGEVLAFLDEVEEYIR